MARLQVNPTRIEIRRCKTRLKAAISGHKLLKDKADEMVRRFIDLVREARILREDVEKGLTDALKKFAMARARSFGEEIEEAVSKPVRPIHIEVSTKSIMGVSVPVIKLKTAEGPLILPYALAAAPPELDEAVFGFHAFMDRLLKLAETEKACALLAEEIEKTRRRVNALEYIMIPQLQETIRFIQEKLDENERGALVRLMKVKSKLESK